MANLGAEDAAVSSSQSVVARGLAGAPGMPAEAMLHLPVSRTKDSLASWLRDMEAVLEKVVQRLQQRERRVVQLKVGAPERHNNW